MLIYQCKVLRAPQEGVDAHRYQLYFLGLLFALNCKSQTLTSALIRGYLLNSDTDFRVGLAELGTDLGLSISVVSIRCVTCVAAVFMVG